MRKNNDNIYINIEPENNLIDYTQNHFLNQMNIDMEKIRDDTNSHRQYNEDNENNENNENNGNTNISNTIYIRDDNSPITISNNNSDDDDEMNGDEMDYENIHNIHSDFHSETKFKSICQSQSHSNCIDKIISKKTKFKKLSYKDIEKSLNQSYTENSKYSNELEILITYY